MHTITAQRIVCHSTRRIFCKGKKPFGFAETRGFALATLFDGRWRMIICFAETGATAGMAAVFRSYKNAGHFFAARVLKFAGLATRQPWLNRTRNYMGINS